MKMGTLTEVNKIDLMEGDIIYIATIDMFAVITVDDALGMMAVIVFDDDESAALQDTLLSMGQALAYKITGDDTYAKLIEEDV